MLLNENISSPVIQSGIGESKKMGILANGKVFKIISDTMYQDKPGSIVRELSCNANDGMTKAGRSDIPWDLHVPTMFEPWFAVKDTGVGMSHDTVMNVFATYFASTKDTSNEEIGGFGLGAKTPFCYTDSFIVISTYEGVRTTYCFMMNEQGEPTGSVLGDEATTDHNGVEVRVDIEQADIPKFVHAIRTQLRFFAVKPNLSVSSVEIEEIEYQADSPVDNIKVPVNLSRHWVVQGGVGYPLNLTLISDKLSESEKQFFNIHDSLVMFFDIGQIEVIPSREAISYGKQTIANIQASIRSAVPAMTKTYVDKANAFTSLIEYIQWLDTTYHAVRMLKLADYDLSTAPCASKYKLSWRGAIADAKLNVNFTYDGKPNKMHLMQIGYNGKKSYLHPEFNGDMSYRLDRLPTFYIRDKATGAIGRLRTLQQQTGGVVNVIEHPVSADKVDAAFIDLIKNQLPFATFVMVSSLPAPLKDPTVKRGTPLVYSKSKGDRFDSISKWERLYEEEEIEGGYYLTFEVYPTIDDNLNGVERELLQLMDEAGMIDKPILAIKASKLADIVGDNPSYVPLKDQIKLLAAEAQHNLFKSKTRLNRYIESKRILGEAANFLNRTGLDHVRAAGLSVKSLERVNRIVNACERYINKIATIVDIEGNSLNEHLFNEYQRSYNDRKFNVALDAEAFRKAYPMLQFSQLGYYGNKVEYGNAVAAYIEMVDKSAA